MEIEWHDNSSRPNQAADNSFGWPNDQSVQNIGVHCSRVIDIMKRDDAIGLHRASHLSKMLRHLTNIVLHVSTSRARSINYSIKRRFYILLTASYLEITFIYELLKENMLKLHVVSHFFLFLYVLFNVSLFSFDVFKSVFLQIVLLSRIYIVSRVEFLFVNEHLTRTLPLEDCIVGQFAHIAPQQNPLFSATRTASRAYETGSFCHRRTIRY